MKSENYKWEWVDSYFLKYNQILQEMKEKSSAIPPDQKLDYLRQVQRLEEEQNRFKASYRKVQESIESEQDQVQDVLHKAWRELEQAFDQVIKKYW